MIRMGSQGVLAEFLGCIRGVGSRHHYSTATRESTRSCMAAGDSNPHKRNQHQGSFWILC